MGPAPRHHESVTRPLRAAASRLLSKDGKAEGRILAIEAIAAPEVIHRPADHRGLGVGRDQPPACRARDRLAGEEPGRVQPEHVALQVHQDDGGRSGDAEYLPTRDRSGAHVASGPAVTRAAKPGPICCQSPEPAGRQALLYARPYLAAGEHRGAKPTTPPPEASLRERYDAQARRAAAADRRNARFMAS